MEIKMGLFSKDPSKGWGGSGKCVITGGKANGTSKTIFGGQVNTSPAVTGKGSGKKK